MNFFYLFLFSQIYMQYKLKLNVTTMKGKCEFLWGESYTGARGKVAYKMNAVQVYCLGLISDSTLLMHRVLS